jgi:hypothetical protein
VETVSMNGPSSPNLVDNPRPGSDRLRPTTPAYAETVESTRSVGSGDRGSRPASGSPESLRIDHSLSERVLLRGYGLDPDDLELEMVRRVRR